MNRAQTEHVQDGYSGGDTVAFLALSLGIVNKQELTTCGVARGRRYLRWNRGVTQGPKFVSRQGE